MVRVDRLSVEDAPRLRAIRLSSLRDSPDAFGSTLEEAEARPPESWSKQLRDLPTFVAVKDGEDVGVVRCARDDAAIGTASLISMWVAPHSRRAGVGSALVD